MILVDSSVWIDYLSSRPGPGGKELRRLIAAGTELAVAGLVVTEVLQGLRRDEREIERILFAFPLLEAHAYATDAFAAAIHREARQRGGSVGTVDVVLAALAIEHEAEFFTLDRDFERLAFSGLRLHALL